jgi:two-component system, NtrC family, response regulator GlrR
VERLKQEIGLKQIIGESPQFLEKVRCLPRFARCDATVLISGESGTGKELFAPPFITLVRVRTGRSFR